MRRFALVVYSHPATSTPSQAFRTTDAAQFPNSQKLTKGKGRRCLGWSFTTRKDNLVYRYSVTRSSECREESSRPINVTCAVPRRHNSQLCGKVGDVRLLFFFFCSYVVVRMNACEGKAQGIGYRVPGTGNEKHSVFETETNSEKAENGRLLSVSFFYSLETEKKNCLPVSPTLHPLLLRNNLQPPTSHPT